MPFSESTSSQALADPNERRAIIAETSNRWPEGYIPLDTDVATENLRDEIFDKVVGAVADFLALHPPESTNSTKKTYTPLQDAKTPIGAPAGVLSRPSVRMQTERFLRGLAPALTQRISLEPVKREVEVEVPNNGAPLEVYVAFPATPFDRLAIASNLAFQRTLEAVVCLEPQEISDSLALRNPNVPSVSEVQITLVGIARTVKGATTLKVALDPRGQDELDPDIAETKAIEDALDFLRDVAIATVNPEKDELVRNSLSALVQEQKALELAVNASQDKYKLLLYIDRLPTTQKPVLVPQIAGTIEKLTDDVEHVVSQVQTPSAIATGVVATVFNQDAIPLLTILDNHKIFTQL